MQPYVYIIILNWNGLEDTSECLESLKKLDYDNFDVILVDNNSSGDDVKAIEEQFGDFILKIIVNNSNLGFSGGNNVGIKYALENGADYVLLLNNDTVVEPDFLSRMIGSEKNDKSTGIITPMINYYSNKDKIWSAGGNIRKIKASGFTFGYNENAEKHNYDKLCTFASGCCMLIKSEVIKDVGLLDENYFLYLEDTDYCQRTLDAGYKILYVGSSKIYHKVFSTTTKQNAMLPLYYSVRNRLYFAKKNLGFFFYLAFFYLATVFLIKAIFVNKFDKEMLKVVYLSFKDFFQNKMGKTDIFDS